MITMHYTQRLFFKKYHTRIVVQVKAKRSSAYWISRCPELQDVNQWASDHLPTNSYKIAHRWQRHDTKGGNIFHTMVYVNDAAHKDAILLQYGSQVMSVTQPANSSHKDELDALNVVVARSTLIYKKFRYVVHFKYMGDQSHTLETWLHKYFHDQPSHTYKLVLDWWSIKVYLADEGDMTAIKLSWHEHIQCIKTVMLVS